VSTQVSRLQNDNCRGSDSGKMFQQSPTYGRGHSMFANAPVTKWCMIACTVLYLLPLLLWDTAGVLKTYEYAAFSMDSVLSKMQMWRVITYQFLHGSGMHLVFNLVGMFFFGRYFEEVLGSRRFIGYYLISGIGGVILFTILYYIDCFPATHRYSQMVGASAAIYGCMMGVAYLAPDQKVYLMFIIPVKLKYMIYFIVLYAVITVVFRGFDSTSNAGGEASHLGGILVGWLLCRNTHWLNFLDKKEIRQSYKRRKQREKQETQAKIKPRAKIDLSDTEVDKILDKISAEGFHSLSEAEKEILNKASKQ